MHRRGCDLDNLFGFCLILSLYIAGYEHVYDFVNHLLGSDGHRGIKINMNHYRVNLTARIRNGDLSRKEFFRADQFRAFIQSGIACWLKSLPKEVDEPCCNLQCLGGDGTAIGVAEKQGIHLDSVWEPKVPVEPVPKWGRNDRRVLAWAGDVVDWDGDSLFEKVPAPAALKDVPFVLEVLKGKTDIPSPEVVQDSTISLRRPIRDEFLRWCGLSAKSPERVPLTQLLKIALSNESVTGAVPRPLLKSLTALLRIEIHEPPETRRDKFSEQLEACHNDLLRYGVGPHAFRIIECQRKAIGDTGNRNLLPSTLAFLIQLVGSATAVFEMIPSLPSSEPGHCTTPHCVNGAGHGIELHNPATTGFDYNCFLKQGGGCERNAWPQPKEGGKCAYFDVSPSDCKKKRTLVMGNGARCSLWVWTCMLHHRIVGYHTIKRGEGKRDAILSLYRFKKDPPKMVFVDFACQAEESALNWLCDYYQDVLFYHDTFHGYGHVCSSRYSIKLLKDMPVSNTSVMEQFNAFLQSIGGILSSGRTRVRA